MQFMKWVNMSSPTPSIDSLSGVQAMGTFVDGSELALGLELTNGCHGSSSSSSTCSSIVFPHISISTGLHSNGYCGIGSNTSNSEFSGLPSPGIGNGLKCGICHDSFTHPKVLPCLHTFCQDCLAKIAEGSDRIYCPSCRQECTLGSHEVKEDGEDARRIANNNNETDSSDNNNIVSFGKTCTGCKSNDNSAVAECLECSHYLCNSCVMAHVFMRCFEGHHVNRFIVEKSGKGVNEVSGLEHHVNCTQHKEEALQYFCRSCAVPVCSECLIHDHPKPSHECEPLASCESKYVKQLSQYIHEFRMKSLGLHDVLKSFETASSTLQARYSKAQNDLNDASAFYRSLLEERKNELMKELETVYSSRQLTLTVVTQRVQETLDRMYQTVEFGDRLLRHASPPQILVFKKLLETRLQALLATVPEPNQAVAMAASGDLEFVANYSAMQGTVRNTLGFIRSNNNTDNTNGGKQPPAPIARPGGTQINGLIANQNGNKSLSLGLSNGHSSLESSLLSKRLANNGAPASYNGLDLGGLRTYETWSSGSDSIFQNGLNELHISSTGRKDFSTNGCSDNFGTSPPNMLKADPLLELTSKMMPPLVFPKGPAIKRQKMTYHYKFGEFGTAEAQFTEPSGVAVNGNNEIIVADTNNHRIQIFDREGRFKFQFGECGKRDGQLLYPNRVAVVKPSGDIVVTERSPTHQIQIYNQYGQFVRKFGATILQHPRGVTVDNKGRVIVVECKVMRVIIFDQNGTVLHKFGCSKHLEFPNGVVVNDKQEIFISDNRAHCVKVFNYEGMFLRQIGGEGLTNYPIGVGINSNGEILVADNHNNFNLTIFTQDGQLVSALESKVKHAQCFDVALMDDGSVVLASKDYRLYIYRGWLFLPLKTIVVHVDFENVTGEKLLQEFPRL